MSVIKPGWRAWLARPLRVQLPGGTRPFRVLSTAVPVVMMVAGVVTATVCALWADEGIGTLGVEAGAAIQFGGAVTFGAQRTTTVLRGLLLVLLAAVGMALIAAALALDWRGAPLTLAMEFGVGAVAVVLVDVVLLGILHPGIERLAQDGTVVTVQLGGPRQVLSVRSEAPDVSSS